MSLRTVADDTLTPGASATWPDPTGWAVSMYSSTTARRMAALRSSSIVGSIVDGYAGTRCYRVPALEHARVRGRRVSRRGVRAEMKASWGTSTRPMFFIRFLPSFCFSSSLRLRVMSPP